MLAPRQAVILVTLLGIAMSGRPSADPEAAPSPSPSSSARRTEVEWLAREICLDVAEILYFAKSRSLLDPSAASVRSTNADDSAAAPRFEILLTLKQGSRPFKHTVAIEDHFWSPGAYAAFARALLDRLDLGAAPNNAAPGPSLLERLTDPRPLVLEAENQRLSQRLGEAPLDPTAHEEAALLVGAFGLREASGSFSDVRPALCRMSAHLALARALRRGLAPTTEGFYAEILLVTLSGRQRDALDRLGSRKPGAAGSELPWINALTMRNSADYRVPGSPEKATLLERREHFLALSRSLGGPKALEALQQRPPEAIADWGRITLESNLGVEAGNVFAPQAVMAELSELSETWQAARGEPLAPDGWIRALDGRPARCVRRLPDSRVVPSVLHWDSWGAFFQRHLAHVLEETERFYASVLGEKEAAQSFRAQAEAKLAGFALYPLVVHLWETRLWIKQSQSGALATPKSTEEEKTCDALPLLFGETPELITARLWDSVTRVCGRQRDSGALPEYSQWFSQALPWGTAFDATSRAAAVHTFENYGASRLEQILRLRPFDASLVIRLMERKYQGKPTPEQFLESAGPLLEYDRQLLSWRIGLVRDDQAEYLPLAERLCGQDPDECVTLGDYLAERGIDEPAAVRAYERAVDQARNRVALSHSVYWLADYYFDHGQQEKSQHIAAMAADVYSQPGLFLQARMFERMGRFKEAEEFYQKIAERYDSKEDLETFYIRREMRSPRSEYQSQAVQAVRELFPQGLRRSFVVDFVPTPTSASEGLLEGLAPQGVGMREPEIRMPMRRLGFGLADLIVAVDGYRVQNWDQLVCVRSFTDAQHLTLIVRRGTRYLQLEGAYPRIRYGP